jgi:hypothetical protein
MSVMNTLMRRAPDREDRMMEEFSYRRNLRAQQQAEAKLRSESEAGRAAKAQLVRLSLFILFGQSASVATV